MLLFVQTPLDPTDAARLAATAFTILILTSAFLRLIFFGDERNDVYKKILGGFSVFLIALIANNDWIYLISLFIGGLLIASEKFLFFLASVFRAEGTQIADIVSDYVRPLTQTEIKAKQGEEVARPLASSQSKSQRTPTSSLTLRERAKKMRNRIAITEREVLAKIDNSMPLSSNFLLREYVAINDNGTDKRFDAAVLSRDTQQILFAFEIRLLNRMRAANVTRFFANLAPHYLSANFQVHFILVFTNLDQDEWPALKAAREEFIASHNAGVSFYRLKDGQLEELLTDDIDIFKAKLAALASENTSA